MPEAAHLVGPVRHATPRQKLQNEAPPRAPAAPADALPTVGLINTCYLNTTLQCLRACPSAVAGVLAAASTSANRAVAALDRVFMAMSSGSTPLDPSVVRRCLPRPYHNAHSTQCAGEALTHLAQATTTCNCPQRCDGFANCSSLGPLPISFEVVTSRTCSVCNTTSRSHEKVERLLVPFSRPSFEKNSAIAEDLQEMVTRLGATERLEGDNQVYCSECKTNVDVDKVESVVTPPVIFAVQVVRHVTVFDEQGRHSGPVVEGRRQALTLKAVNELLIPTEITMPGGGE
jgi:hypothetical protein